MIMPAAPLTTAEGDEPGHIICFSAIVLRGAFRFAERTRHSTLEES
jgi:hypothetical protein